jgi:hypothetical protein
MTSEDVVILTVFIGGFVAILALTLVIDAIMRRFED